MIAETDKREEVRGMSLEMVGKTKSTEVKGNMSVEVTGGFRQDVGRNIFMTSRRTVHIDSKDRVILRSGKSQITMDSDGTISLDGNDIRINGTSHVGVNSKKIDLN